MAEESNYHILLWPEPPGPPLYQCLLCPLTDRPEAEILAHLPEVHGVPPVPTPMVNDPLVIDESGALMSLNAEGRRMPPDTPTYYLSQEPHGPETFHCLQCEAEGYEHHATDPALFAQHMAQRHDGRMQMTPDGKKPEHPHGGPPGHTGEHPDHPHGGPPGQEGTPEEGAPEDGEEPHPEHPMVDPDEEPHPEHPITEPEEGV